MRPVGQGRGGTETIPDLVSQYPPVAATMTAVVSLRGPGVTKTWDATSGQTEYTPAASYWTGRARIQALTGADRAAGATGDKVYVRGYLITVPVTVTTVTPSHIVTVTACTDTTLVGRDLTVDGVARGSLLVERDLFCTLSDD